MSIIFSADDFGKSAIANKNILSLIRKKKIDRVAIMANGRFGDEEVKQLIGAKIKLDLHLETKNNFYKEGNRLLNFLRIYYLGRDDIISRDRSRPVRTRPVRTNPVRIWPINVEKVREDWQTQIEKFMKIFGQKPDGLSSHEHVHFFPPYFSLILALCEEFKITFLRFGSCGIKTQYSPIGLVLAFLNKINQGKFRRCQSKYPRLRSTDYLISLDWIQNFAHPPTFKEEKESIEIVCHPDKQAEYEFLKNRNE